MREEYRVLGKLEVVRDDENVELGAFLQRELLAYMLTKPNTVVSTDELIDGLWGEDAGPDKQNSLWVYISGIRKALEHAKAQSQLEFPVIGLPAPGRRRLSRRRPLRADGG